MSSLARGLLIALLLITILFSLGGCRRVADARGDFCDALRPVGALAVDLKRINADTPSDQLRTRVESLEKAKATLERLAKLTPIPAIDRLSASIDQVVQAAGQATGDTLGPAAEQVGAAGLQLEEVYTQVNDAVCAAK
jgi:hypothetical protein